MGTDPSMARLFGRSFVAGWTFPAAPSSARAPSFCATSNITVAFFNASEESEYSSTYPFTIPDVNSREIDGVAPPLAVRSSTISRSVARNWPSVVRAARNECSTLPRRPRSSTTAILSTCARRRPADDEPRVGLQVVRRVDRRLHLVIDLASDDAACVVGQDVRERQLAVRIARAIDLGGHQDPQLVALRVPQRVGRQLQTDLVRRATAPSASRRARRRPSSVRRRRRSANSPRARISSPVFPGTATLILCGFPSRSVASGSKLRR